jgi:hypothetical protein
MRASRASVSLGWTIPEIVFCVWTAHLPRLDKLSPAAVPLWHNCQLSPVLPPGSFRQLKPAPEGRAGQLLHRWQPAGYPQRRHSSNIPRRGVTRTVVASSDLEPARDASRMRGGLPQMHEMKRHQGQSGFPTPVGSPRLRRSSPGARMVRHCGGLCYGRGIACYGRR